MKVLTSIKEYLEPGLSDREVLDNLLTALKFAFDEQADSREAYISTDCAEDMDALFGRDEPFLLTVEAQGWNKAIQTEFARSLKNFIEKNPDWEKGEITLDNSDTYTLKKTAIAVDNSWYDYAERMTYLDNEFSFDYFQPALTDEQLKKIADNPEDYVIVDITVK